MTRYKIQISGIVQGVGFRPFVKNLSLKYQINGFVKNDSSGVEIEAQGVDSDLDEFVSQIRQNPPPLAKIVDFSITQIALQNDEDFKIILSDGTKTKTTFVSPDMKICKDCISDITNPKSRFYGYFATNCTNCGPRYSIIKTIPYDRKNTSMREFEMCDECKKEYNDSSNRRFHAQPIACAKCGPKLYLYDQNRALIDGDALMQTERLIKEGKIVAIKGLGGFHIVCDATNCKSIEKLRNAKNRPFKPFALMCRDMEQVQKFAFLNEREKEVLLSKESPIVILDIKDDFSLSPLIAPHIKKIGCMLPYTPLQVLLFESLDYPIIATSANLGDEPIIVNIDGIYEKLPFVEFVLDFDREIVNGVDDSLVQVVDDKVQILRCARGYAPLSMKLQQTLAQNTLCVGANQKNTIAFGYGDNLVLSPHIGDLDSLANITFFKNTLDTFKSFYDFEPEIIVCDKHPNYETTKWAKEQGIKLKEVQHHKAHLGSVRLEHGLSGDFVGFIFDGTGYGDDGALWGGEVFVGESRKYHFKPIKLLGGEKAIKEPRRVALSILFERFTFDEVREMDLECVKSFDKDELRLLYTAYTKNINAPLSSSVGRIFDALASFAGVLQVQSYEGESGLRCEALCLEEFEEKFDYVLGGDEIDIDILSAILNKTDSKRELCTKLLNTLSDIIIQIATNEKLDIILGGGVFQNKTLLQKVLKKAKPLGINVYFGCEIPVNDGGISVGQLWNVALDL